MSGVGPAADYSRLPEALPAPVDDDAAAHLAGTPLPRLVLPASDGSRVDLASLAGLTVIYAYPMTGQPGVALPEGWDEIPGARGCTPQSCSFRDHFGELRALGVAAVYGLSTQPSDYQAEAAERLHLPFPLLSDAELRLCRALRLPTLEVDGKVLLKRLTMVVAGNVIRKVFYPVFPPDRNAEEVIAYLSGSAGRLEAGLEPR